MISFIRTCQANSTLNLHTLVSVFDTAYFRREEKSFPELYFFLIPTDENLRLL
jgi:hypothetical protein